MFSMAELGIVERMSAVDPVPNGLPRPRSTDDVAVRTAATRRERLRAATRAELVEAARAELVDGGWAAVTLRAVASRLDMTAPAIYRYFSSREALLEEVVAQLYDELAIHLEQASAPAPDRSLTCRFLNTMWSFRSWALEHGPEFSLLFGAPVPGVGSPDDPVLTFDSAGRPARGARFGRVWISLFVELAQTAGVPPPQQEVSSGLRQQVQLFLDRTGVPLDVDSTVTLLLCWQGLYGFICTEAFGHLRFAVEDAHDLFSLRIEECRRLLELPLQ